MCALQLRHHADPAAGQLEDVVERRNPVLAELGGGPPAERAAERRQAVEVEVVEDDELAVRRDLDVELDEVRAELDRPLERRQRVLALAPRTHRDAR